MNCETLNVYFFENKIRVVMNGQSLEKVQKLTQFLNTGLSDFRLPSLYFSVQMLTSLHVECREVMVAIGSIYHIGR